MGNCSLDMGLMHHFPTKLCTKHNPSCHGSKGYTWAALREKVPSGLSRTIWSNSTPGAPFKKKKVMLVFVDILMAQWTPVSQTHDWIDRGN